MSRSAQEIQDWIVGRVSALAGVGPGEIDPREPVTRLGLDSVAVVVLAGELEDWLGYKFRANPFEEHPTIEALSRFLEEQVAKGG